MLRIVVLATSLTLEGSGLHICWNSNSGRKGSLPTSAWMTHVGMDLSTWLLLCRAICQYVTTSGYHPHCWCCRSLIKPESYQGEIACLKLQLCLNYSNWLHDELITESYYQVSVSNSLHFSNCHIVLEKNGCVRCSTCIKQYIASNTYCAVRWLTHAYYWRSEEHQRLTLLTLFRVSGWGGPNPKLNC